jgi:hypothetical protein
MSESGAPTTHVLQSTAESVSSGVLDPARPPALTIDAGDIVSYPNTWTQWVTRLTTACPSRNASRCAASFL